MTNTALNEHLSDCGIFYSLYEYLPKAIFIMDLNGNCLHANRAAELLTGYSIEECRQISFFNLLSTENVQMTLTYLEKTLQGEPQEYENVLIHKEGHRIDVDVTVLPIKLNEKVIGFFVVAKDITKRKQVDEELTATKEYLESFINNTADGIVIQDLNGKIQRVNKSFEKMFGYNADEIEGRDMSLIVPQHLKSELLELRKKVVHEQAEIMDLQIIRQRKDGQILTVSVTKSPIKDAKGNIIAISGIVRDITERKKAEEALAEAEAKYRSLVEEALVGVYIQQQGKFLYVNPRFAEIFGYKQETMTQLNIMDVCYESDRCFLAQQLQRRMNGEKLPPYQIHGVRKDKSIIDIEIHGALTSYNGTPATIGTIMDITESKKTQELLMKSEKLTVLGQLAAGIGHEIRNPLTSIKGFVQLLQSKVNERDQYFEIILSELNRINSIVSEFMVLAKPQALNFQNRNIVTLLQNILPLLETQAILTNVQIFTVFGSDIPLINCEENQIKQVFINIIKNSLDSMPNGGAIFVHVKKENPNHILIRFTDEGSGIPEELLPKLGEPFYTTKEKGTGLGLMVSHKIVENHKGKINITSEVGNGTVVDVILPISSNSTG